MLKAFFICAVSLLACIACSPVKTSIAPVVNSAGEICFVQPYAFDVTEQTRQSTLMRFNEDVVSNIDEEILDKHLNITPTEDTGAIAILYTEAAKVQEKGKKYMTGIIAPAIVIKYQNVSTADIEAAVPMLQKVYFRELSLVGRMIPTSHLEETEHD